MKHSRTYLVTTSSSHASSRGASRHNTIKIRGCLEPATHSGEPINQCYRALLETSSSAILLLSPASIILGWNRGVETVSGWIADEALGRNYIELYLPMKARETFLSTLAQAIEVKEVRGFKSPLRTRMGSRVMLSWNSTRVHMRLYRDDAMVTLAVTDNGKGITRERATVPHGCGLRGTQKRASLLGGNFHLAGTSGVGTAAIASVPAAEGFVP